jgi:hypothetical protein
MPDTFSMSLILIGIYFGSNYFDTKNDIKNLILYGTFTLLGILTKLPSGYLLILLLPFILSNKIQISKKINFSFVSIIIFGAVYYWYFVWVPYLVNEYQFWHFYMGNSLTKGFVEIGNNLSDVLKNFYENAIKYIAFIFFIFGLIAAFVKKNKRITLIFILSSLTFLLVLFKAGTTFAKHDYYIIPFVPVMALISGYGISLIKNKKVVLYLLIFIAAEGVLNQKTDIIIKEKNLALLSLESDLDQFSDRSDLVLINSGNYPTPMYFSHRKGWVNSNSEILKKDYIKELESRGLKYIIILKRTFGQEINLPYKEIVNNNNYIIYKL